MIVRFIIYLSIIDSLKKKLNTLTSGSSGGSTGPAPTRREPGAKIHCCSQTSPTPGFSRLLEGFYGDFTAIFDMKIMIYYKCCFKNGI